MKIALCVSGNLGFSIFFHLLDSGANIACIFTDKQSKNIIEQAVQHNIPYFIGNPRKGRAYQFISKYSVDILLSVNYLFLFDEDVINWPRKFAINVHGSLLPKYRGRTPHVWAIINNEEKTGITAHLIDDGCDTGPLVKQFEICIGKQDTGGSILEKYSEKYPVLLSDVLHSIERGTINPMPQDESKATYFGKRTPDDGEINWYWQKERIRNWVRAQALPYPGAFTWVGQEKMIIDEIAFDDTGFHSDIPNGTVLSLSPVRVKTPNGVIRIEKDRGIPETLRVNQRLG